MKQFLRSKVPPAIIETLRKIKNKFRVFFLRHQHQNIGEESYFDPSVQVLGWKNIKIGHHSCIGQDTWININHREAEKIGLIIGNNCFIGRRNFFSSGDYIKIGDYCLTGVDCHFLGSDHIYTSPFLPYIITGTTNDGIINVGVNCWLGASVTVLKGVSIGYGSIIGSATVVTKSIPPLSIVVGNPCRIIKRFDLRSHSWVNIDRYPEDGDKYLLSETEYLENLRKGYPVIQMPLIASSKLLGDL
jgi:acetyltransferase-like isoleucine patch superfamily enzyme